MTIDADEIAPIGELRPAQYIALARSIQNRTQSTKTLNVALLSSNSFSFLEPYITVECARIGIAATPQSTPFGQIEQCLLEPRHVAVKSANVVVIGLRVEDIYPDAFLRARSANGPAFVERLATCLERVLDSVSLVREHSDARVLVANFALPMVNMNCRLFDANDPAGARFTVAQVNGDLAAKLAKIPGADIWDYAGLVAGRGALTWTDPRLWALSRQPIAASNLPYAAEHLAKTIGASIRARAKVLVLDLDNTLWGGAAGDEGVQGIELGDDHPGSSFKTFQSAILGLRDQGILLAISSKNDEEVARHVIQNHPEMKIAWEDFVSVRINWQAKSDNIRQIAAEIGVGVDSLVFFDDSPVERAEVRLNAPEVHCIEVPTSPLHYTDALLGSGCFDAPTLSSEDSSRAKQYQEEGRRMLVKKKAASLEDFLASLKMCVEIYAVDDNSINRVSQLIGKTNQFNLTTRRHDQSRLAQLAAAENCDIYCFRLKDKFGDSGVVGVYILEYQQFTATIDSLVMSCRVMNRKLEHAMLSDMVNKSISRGCSTISGEYISNEKNTIVANLYPDWGFVKDRVKDASIWYSLDLKSLPKHHGWPDVIKRV